MSVPNDDDVRDPGEGPPVKPFPFRPPPAGHDCTQIFRAEFDDEGVYFYQAYNDEIGRRFVEL